MSRKCARMRPALTLRFRRRILVKLRIYGGAVLQPSRLRVDLTTKSAKGHKVERVCEAGRQPVALRSFFASFILHCLKVFAACANFMVVAPYANSASRCDKRIRRFHRGGTEYAEKSESKRYLIITTPSAPFAFSAANSSLRSFGCGSAALGSLRLTVFFGCVAAALGLCGEYKFGYHRGGARGHGGESLK
jgi:hypothetical protein